MGLVDRRSPFAPRALTGGSIFILQRQTLIYGNLRCTTRCLPSRHALSGKSTNLVVVRTSLSTFTFFLLVPTLQAFSSEAGVVILGTASSLSSPIFG